MPTLRLVALATAACLVAAVAPASASSLVFTGIRPGTHITTSLTHGALNQPVGPSCTADFVLQPTAGAFDPTQQLYIGTAGHCFDVGDAVRAVTVTPGTGQSALVTFGTVVQNFGPADDFELIAIDPVYNSWVSPSMAHWGGPTGVYTGTPGPGAVATYIGNGGLAGGTVPRAGEMGDYNVGRFGITGLVAEGDSGGPVTVDGLAVGELTNIRHTDSLGLPAGILADGTSIAAILSLTGLQLATCPTATPWPLPGCPPL